MRRLLVFALLGFAASCGKSTAAPDPIPDTSLTFYPLVSPLYIGASEAAHVVSNAGGPHEVAATGAWVSDNPAVASVSASGAVSGIGSGQTTVHVSASGSSGTSPVRVVPNYGAGFTFTATPASCTSTPPADCAAINHAGQGSFSPSQAGSSVTFIVNVGDGVPQTKVVEIALDGGVAFSASTTFGGFSYTYAYRFNTANGHDITGTLRVDFSATGGASSGSINFAIVGVAP